MATIYRLPGERSKSVSRSWILRFSWKVERIEVKYAGPPCTEYILIAFLSDGRIYQEAFKDPEECWRFVHRPSLFETPLGWLGEEMTIQYGMKGKYRK